MNIDFDMVDLPLKELVPAILVMAVLVGFGSWAVCLRVRLSTAQRSLAKAEETLQGYRIAAQDQQERLRQAEEQAKAGRASTLALLQALGKPPEDDEAARRWAINAATAIR